MKKLSILLPVLLLAFAPLMTNAQELLKEGMVKMEITEVNSDNPQMAAQLEMMKGTATEYHFSPEKSLSNSNMMGGMVKVSVLTDNSSEGMTMLFDAMGQKMMVEASKAEMDKMNEGQENAAEKVNIVYDKNDTKEILGYKCYKAVITPKDGEDMQMEFSMYITDDVKADNKLIQGLQNYDLQGFPLQMIMEMPEMTMTFSATDLKKSVDKSVFELNTTGYTKMSFEEFQQSMGGMGGGMGF